MRKFYGKKSFKINWINNASSKNLEKCHVNRRHKNKHRKQQNQIIRRRNKPYYVNYTCNLLSNHFQYIFSLDKEQTDLALCLKVKSF